MLTVKAFAKKTKRGKVLRIVREHYLRNDIWSGCSLDPDCDPAAYKLDPAAPHFLLVDTNVALSHIDFLEHQAVDNVILLSVVLQEVKHRNASVYTRLRALAADDSRKFYVFVNEHHQDTFIQTSPGETPNNRNDRAIRVATSWYQQRMPGKAFILLTNDADNCRKAVADGLTAMTVQRYAGSRSDTPDLLDIVAKGEEAERDDPGAAGGRQKRARIFREHQAMSLLTAGVQAGRYHQGPLRVSRYNPFEGYVSSASVGADMLVSGREDMNRALDGDIVAVELLPESQWRAAGSRLAGGAAAEGPDAPSEGDEDVAPAEATAVTMAQVALGSEAAQDSTERRPTGRVVGIITRNWRTRGYAGSLQPPRPGSSSYAVLFCPVERRFPLIRLHTRQLAQLQGKRLVVVIDRWDADSAYPSGHYVRTLGPVGDRATETEMIILEHDINTNPFTPAVHACVPRLPWAVGAAEHDDPHREDLRHLCVCSVDPPGCKDIDDALHVRALPNGNWEVGVHIADVTYFLKPDTPMDEEAARRATTVYLVQKRVDMLPKPLTEDICSLRGGVERCAFSTLWEMDAAANVVDVRFCKSVIQSRAALTYAEAQLRIDDARQTDEVTASLRHMNRLSKVLRQKRLDAGALTLASPEVRFEMDTETHNALDVGMYQIKETNQMVEEMMLLANVTVARRITEAFPAYALLRRHQTPAPAQFEPLLKAAAAVGLSLDVDSSKQLAASLDAASRPDDPYFNKLLRILTTRCMTQAQYFAAGEASVPEYRHYGLATPIYTHFTSPIRRYADVIVHRLLSAALGLDPLPDALRDATGMRGVIDNINVRHRNAQQAGRASVLLQTVIFFRGKDTVADGRVIKVMHNALIVFVPKYGIEGSVLLAPEDGLAMDEGQQCVRDAAGSVVHRVFDKVAVRIRVEESSNRRELKLTLEDRALLPAKERLD